MARSLGASALLIAIYDWNPKGMDVLAALSLLVLCITEKKRQSFGLH